MINPRKNSRPKSWDSWNRTIPSAAVPTRADAHPDGVSCAEGQVAQRQPHKEHAAQQGNAGENRRRQPGEPLSVVQAHRPRHLQQSSRQQVNPRHFVSTFGK